MASTVSVQVVQIADVRSVYSGKPGCMCGCRGKHSYAGAHREEAGQNRGYAVSDDEVNNAQVTRVLRAVQGALAGRGRVDVARLEGSEVHFFAEVGGREMVVYLTKAATERLFGAATMQYGDVVSESVGCAGDWTGREEVCGACCVARSEHWTAIESAVLP